MIVIAGYDPENAPRPTPENVVRGKAWGMKWREKARWMDTPIVERRTGKKRDIVTHRSRTNDLVLPLKSEAFTEDLHPAKPRKWLRWDTETSISKRVKRAG